MARLPVGTVTFLFTDIEGSTALLQRLGDRRYADLLEEHRRLLQSAFAEGHGQVVDTQGDAFLVAFSRARDAVGTAVAAQRALTKHAWPDGAALRVRMGLHTGEPVSETEGYVGLDVHRAARICSAGHGGQVLLSQTAAALAAPDLPSGASLRDLGNHRLKDLQEPERLFQVQHPDLATDFPALKSAQVAAAAAAATMASRRRRWVSAAVLPVIAVAAVAVWRAGLLPTTGMPRSPAVPAARMSPARMSIVVLPFTSLGQETRQPFADAIVQDLTTDLTHIAGSFVIAWGTAQTYRGKVVDPKQIGRDLGVRYVLEGTVERADRRVRVTAQLVDADTNYQVWAERFDRELNDLFAVQDDVTARIAGALKMRLTHMEPQRAERTHADPAAMEYVMRGRMMRFQPPSKGAARREAAMYERALQMDPRLPAAQIGLASALAAQVLDGLSDAPEADLRRAGDLVSNVLAVDPNDWFAHHVNGEIFRAEATILGRRDRFRQAIAEYETAIRLNPSDAGGSSDLARSQIMMGAPAKAIPALEHAMRISPRDPEMGSLRYRMGLAHLLLGHIDDAIAWYQQALPSLSPAGTAYVEFAAALSLKGDMPAARAALAEAARRDPRLTTIAGIRGELPPSSGPKYRALLEHTVIKGLRKAGVPEG